MTITPGTGPRRRLYDGAGDSDSYDEATGTDGKGRRRGGRVPGRVVLLVGLILVVLVITSTGSTRSWWAHRLHDITGGSRPADYVLGLAVGLLPVLGVGIGAFRSRGARRLFRMLLLGGAGFIATYLLSPSPARYLSNHSTGRVFDQQAPSYLPGVFTAAAIWLALVVIAVLRARAAWRRFARRGTVPPDQHKVIDV